MYHKEMQSKKEDIQKFLSSIIAKPPGKSFINKSVFQLLLVRVFATHHFQNLNNILSFKLQNKMIYFLKVDDKKI